MSDRSEPESPQAHEEEEPEEEEEEAETPVDRLRTIFAADTSVGKKATLGKR